MSIRKPIQICAVPSGSADISQTETVCNYTTLYALCNDGTIWAMTSETGWVELPEIPQDEKKEPDDSNVECSSCGVTFYFYYPKDWIGDSCSLPPCLGRLRLIEKTDCYHTSEADKETHALKPKRFQPQ